MKHTALLVLVAAALLAMPGSASARDECANGGMVDTSPQASPHAWVAACVDTDLAIDGGYVEAGNGPPGTYTIIDGSDDNPSGTLLVGYAGVSTYDTGSHDDCDPNVTNAPGPIEDTTDEGDGHNGGGCLTIRGVASIPGVPLACGDVSGADWAAAGRDGCTLPPHLLDAP